MDTPLNKFLVSKETGVLLRWERETQEFGIIERVNKAQIWKAEVLNIRVNLLWQRANDSIRSGKG